MIVCSEHTKKIINFAIIIVREENLSRYFVFIGNALLTQLNSSGGRILYKECITPKVMKHEADVIARYTRFSKTETFS